MEEYLFVDLGIKKHTEEIHLKIALGKRIMVELYFLFFYLFFLSDIVFPSLVRGSFC
jgi:hypothetical protein